MLELFKAFIKKEKPDYILELRVSHSQQLYAATCKYAKGDRYFVASTFFTDAWICKSAGGPLVEGAQIQCQQLTDVAIIHEFSTYNLCTDFPVVTDSDLEDYLSKIKMSTVKQFDSLFEHNEYGDRIESKLTLAPIPAILVSVLNSNSLVGTLVVLPTGNVYSVLACNPRLEHYVRLIQDMMSGNSLSRREELGVAKLCLGE